MISCSTLFEMEMLNLDRMSRAELLDAIRQHWDNLPADLRVILEDESTDQLRLLLMAARLLHTLRLRLADRAAFKNLRPCMEQAMDLKPGN
jgi:hypothetical protein